MGVGRKSAKGFLWCLIVLFCAFPIAVLIRKSFLANGAAGQSLYLQVLSDSSNLAALKNTLVVCSMTALVACIIGVPLSWMVMQSNLCGKRRWKTLFSLPYLIPPYIGAIAWIELANPQVGYLNQIYRYFTGHEGAIFNIYSLFGLIWVMALFFYPFVFLVVCSAMENLDRSFEEAARMSGATAWKAWREITFPMLLPSIAGGAILVFLAAAASFGVPQLIGSPFRLFVLTTKIYSYMQSYGDGMQRATVLSIIFMGGSLVVVGFNHWLLTRRRYTTVGGKASYGEAHDLGKWKGTLFVICVLFFVVTSLFPLMTLLGTSLLKSYAVGWKWGNFGFSKYLYVLRDLEITRHALINSTLLAVCCATLGTVAGFFAAYFEIRERKRGGQILQSLVTLPYATPGIVVAVAMILAFSGQFGLNLYNTLWILGAAYFAKYLNFAARSIAAALVQVDISLEEAGWMCGAGWLKSIRDILLPALKPALIGSWFLIFMPVFSELTMSILLYGPGTETVGTVLFELQNYADPQAGAVLAMVVVVLVLTSNSLVKWATDGKYGF